jgi:hypothetical protein
MNDEFIIIWIAECGFWIGKKQIHIPNSKIQNKKGALPWNKEINY